MKIFLSLSTLFLLSGIFNNIRASVLAVVDTGIDITHLDIAPSVWVNPVDLGGNNFDEDRNGFLNDVNGWNFVENNAILINGKYTKYLTPEIRRFFEIQSNVSTGNVEKEDILWAKKQLRNKKFLRYLSIYSNYMHGTHVGGIAIQGTKDARLLSVKLGTAGSAEAMESSVGSAGQNRPFWGGTGSSGYLSYIVKSHTNSLTEIVDYLDGHDADVANFSFGVSYQHAKEIVTDLMVSDVFASSYYIEKATRSFLTQLIEEGRKMVKRAPDTLFVIAAGNEGTNNDTLWTFPANLNSENTISVAATLMDRSLASFSNYGKRTVDIAAPGVAIRSTVPGNEYLPVSGTSQAAPFVAKAASMVQDANPTLSPKQIKKILMKTVAKKSFLKNKIISGGVLHEERAVYAAELSNVMSVDSAIEHSLKEISDPFIAKSNPNPFAEELKELVLPLPSIFSLAR